MYAWYTQLVLIKHSTDNDDNDHNNDNDNDYNDDNNSTNAVYIYIHTLSHRHFSGRDSLDAWSHAEAALIAHQDQQGSMVDEHWKTAWMIPVC